MQYDGNSIRKIFYSFAALEITIPAKDAHKKT